MSMYNSLLKAAIPVNYISKFWELFEATTYNITTKKLITILRLDVWRNCSIYEKVVQK